MAGNYKEINDEQFEEEVKNSDKPVLVDFWAPWCGPCRQLAPLFEDLSNEYGDKVKFVKLNVDENKSTAAELGVRGIPNIVLFQDGKAVESKVGKKTKSEYVDLIEKVI